MSDQSYPLAGHQQSANSPCNCHDCTQARYRGSFQWQIDQATRLSQDGSTLKAGPSAQPAERGDEVHAQPRPPLYSITPERAKSAARELRISTHNLDGERGTSTSPDNPANKKWLDSVVEGDAAIILRHAEQSAEDMKTPWCLNGHEVLTPGCESCLLDLQKRYNDALRKVQGEGEMREALRKISLISRLPTGGDETMSIELADRIMTIDEIASAVIKR